MAGFFRDPTDSNRKARGVRPFAGQTHEPGTGPLKSNPVRRQTLAPFRSPFAEPREPRKEVMLPLSSDESQLSESHAGSIPEPQSIDANPAVDSSFTDAWNEPREEPAAVEPDPAPALNTTDLQRNAGDRDADNDWLQSITDLEPSPAESEQDDWFADASGAVEEVIDDASAEDGFAGIESLEAPASFEWTTEETAAQEPEVSAESTHAGVEESSEELASTEPQLPLSPDWAVSSDAEADFHAYTAALDARERASETLETVARRVRSGEIVVAIEPGATAEAVLASVLTSLLTNST